MQEHWTSGLRILTSGSGSDTLLLLHGLGATADVWTGLSERLEGRWSGRLLAPDLPGHGRSAPLPRYAPGTLAAALVPILDVDDRVLVVGHSLGGVIGLVLASGWYGLTPRGVVALDVKVTWTPEELAANAAFAVRPSRTYPTYQEAAARALRVSGLQDLLGVDDPRLGAGLVEEGDGWRLALDPKTFAVGAPDMSGLLAAARCPVVLATGEEDPMVSEEELAALVPDPVTLRGLGHNVHVEDPAAVLGLLERLPP